MPLNIARWRWRTTLLMAFFGLTALGPQSTFETSLVDFSYLNVFTPADQEEAFSAIDGGRGYLEGDQVSAFLSALYHGEPKACDRMMFMEELGVNSDSHITLDDIRSTMNQLNIKLRERVGMAKWQRGSGSDFDSNQAFREMVRRHEFIKRGPRERYDRTLTAGQEQGWRNQSESWRERVHGKKSCPETVYASELVKSGIYF